MRRLLALSEALDRFISRIGKWAAWLLLPLVAVIIVDVISRKFQLLTLAREALVNAGIEGPAWFIETYLTSTKFQELEWHFHAALFLIVLGYGYVRNSHVRIELVRDRFSLRTKAWLELIGCIIFLTPYAVLVLYFSADFAHRSFEMNEVSSALTGLSHRWIIKSFVPIGMIELRERAQMESPELHSAEEELRREAEKKAAELLVAQRLGGGGP
jgi:TRAP-type mannitol/chloroaromatic compound transport system permease small subunit